MTEMTENERTYGEGTLFDGRYRLVRALSTAGGSANVWLAVDLNTIDETTDVSRATKVAVKIYRPRNAIDVEGVVQFRNEFRKVFSCHHENIITPAYFSIYGDMPYLVLPYCPSGSSETLIGRMRSDDEIWKYIYEVASGLAYLHERSPRIIHQDIKPANVLIDDNGNYAITDFGISAATGASAHESDDETGGTYAYMAPERFTEGTTPMTESDVWAFGATLYELITGDAPFGDDGGIRQQKDTAIPPISVPVHESVRQLVYACLAFDPADRPRARDIVDTVLRRRYARNRKTVAAAVAAAVLAGVALTFYITGSRGAGADGHLDSLKAAGDSVVAAEVAGILHNSGVPVPASIEGLEKANVFYSRLCDDAPHDYSKKDSVISRINTVNRLIEEIREFDRAQDLAEKARLTDMEAEYLEYSIIADNHRITINQLIQQLK